MTDDLFMDGIDGVHCLRRRERTRLWYRTLPPVDVMPAHLRAAIQHAPHLAVTASDLLEAARVQRVHSHDDFKDRLVEEWPPGDMTDLLVDEQPVLTTSEREARIRNRLGMQLDIEPVTVELSPVEKSSAPLTDWRIVPQHAPTLLLATSALLDSRQPGPILSPGSRFRMLMAEDGIVELEVMTADGSTAVGFCNAVDLNCIAPMWVNIADAGWKGSSKQRLQRITKGLNQVTSTLTGYMS